MSFPIKGVTALVTGANRGIGEAIVDALVAAGAAKVYAAARNTDDLAAIEMRHGGKVVGLRLDITDAAQISDSVQRAGDVCLLVNNAGFAGKTGGDFVDAGWIDAARKELDVNFFGTLAVTQAFAPVLARNGGGAIVNLGSVASFVNFPILLAYSASKAAVHSMTQAARVLLKPQGTRVFGVYPGPIDTRMAEGIPFAKTSPAEAAHAIVAGIESGNEEIFPDPMSQSMGSTFLTDPKGLERQVAATAG